MPLPGDERESERERERERVRARDRERERKSEGGSELVSVREAESLSPSFSLSLSLSFFSLLPSLPPFRSLALSSLSLSFCLFLSNSLRGKLERMVTSIDEDYDQLRRLDEEVWSTHTRAFVRARALSLSHRHGP